jgi:hypothetical protein
VRSSLYLSIFFYSFVRLIFTFFYFYFFIGSEMFVKNDKQTDGVNVLAPIITVSLLSVIIALVVAFGCLIYRKRKNPPLRKSTNVDEPIYESPDGQQTASGRHEETTENTEGTTYTEPKHEATKDHVYQSPTARTSTPVNVNEVSYVAMEPQYMDLSNQGNAESENNYQPLSSQTRKTKLENVTYDVPVQSSSNVYETIKTNGDKGVNSPQCHYYKGLERSTVSRADQ